MSWPDAPAAGPLGDGRCATLRDRPSSLADLGDCVARRVAEGHAIYPQGGGTALDFGRAPARPGAAIDTRSLHQVIDYPYADMTITVEAGITLGELQRRLAEQNQRVLIDAPRPDEATLGGIYATNTCGPRRFGAGRPRDQILGVGFINASGALVRGGGRVVKNVAGYDFPRLLTGSMGTLGVLVEMTLKVRPRPESSALVWATLSTAEVIGATLDALNASGTRPIAIELLNPTAARRLGEPLGLVASGWVLVVGLEDNRESVDWQLDQLRRELPAGTACEVRRDHESEPLWRGLTEFAAAPDATLSIRANLRPSDVGSFAAEFAAELWSLAAHAGNGIIRAVASDPIALADVAPEIDRLRALAVRGGGNLTIARCPTDWKDRLKVWGEPRPDWAICERIKNAFDPGHSFNPGRFVGAI